MFAEKLRLGLCVCVCAIKETGSSEMLFRKISIAQVSRDAGVPSMVIKRSNFSGFYLLLGF